MTGPDLEPPRIADTSPVPETRSGAGKSITRWTLLALGLFLLSFSTLRYIAGERAGLLEDDSYFYAQIAFNVQKLGFLSFDGVHATSGFHLLWGAVLAAVAEIVGLVTQDKAVHLAAFLSVWFTVLWALARRVARAPLGRAAFVGIGLLTAPLMETALVSLLLIGLAELVRDVDNKKTPAASVFLLSALIPLTRIDASLVLLLWIPLVVRTPRLFRPLLAGLVAGLAAHFAVLQVFFGHLYSVSSMLKVSVLSGGPQALRSLAEFGTLVRVLLLLLLILWSEVANFSHRKRWSERLLWGGPVFFTLGHVLVSDVRSWYFLPGFAFAFWAAGGDASQRASHADSPGRSLSRLTRPLWWAVLGSTVVLTSYKLYRFLPLSSVRQGSWDFVAELREKVPPTGRLYQIDGSGFTGYWSERVLFNGDGLVNTYEYAARMKAKKLGGYFEENDICYLITDAPLRNKEAPLVRRSGLKLSQNEAAEILRSAAYGWSKNPNAHFILWKLKDSRCSGS